MHKYTRVCLAIMFEYEDRFDSGNVEALHSRNIRIGDSKGGIIMRHMEFSPSQCCMYAFPNHTMDTTDITRGMINSHIRCIYADIAVKIQMFGQLGGLYIRKIQDFLK